MGTIQRQGIINTGIIYIGVLLGFLNTIVIQPHFLTPDEVGLARIMVSFSVFLTPFLLLGSASVCVRFFPAFRDREKQHHGFLGFTLLIAIAGLIAGGIIFFFLKDWIKSRYIHESKLFVDYFFWTFPIAIVMTLGIAVNAYSYSILKTTVPSFLNDIWVRTLLIIFTFAYSFHFISLDFFVMSIFITYASQFLLILLYVFVVDRPGLRIDWPFVRSIGLKKILGYSVILTLTALSSLSMKFLDTVMIGAYLPLKFVGIYSIGAFIAQFIETPLYSLERIANGKISHAFQANNMEEIDTIYRKSVKYLFLLGGFLVVCIVTSIHDFVLLLPKDYHDAAGVTIIMSIGSIVNMATGVNSPILNNSSKYKWGVVFLFFLLVISVLLNLYFIPRFGIEGAAIATGLASALFNLVKYLFIWKNFGFQPYDSSTLKTLLVIALSFAAAFFLPLHFSPIVSIIIRGTVVVAVYGTSTLLLRIVPEYHHLPAKWLGLRKRGN